MAASWLLRTGIVVLLGFAAVAAARAAMPGSELTKLTETDDTFTSPDGQVIIEQYSKDKGEYDHVYEFWAFDAKHEHGVLLNPGEDLDVAGYPAGFRFSPNSQWVVRMQKIGSGTQTMFLYRRNGPIFRGDAEAAGRHGLGLFLQPANLPQDPSQIRRTAIRSTTPRSIWSRESTTTMPRRARKWPDSRYLVLEPVVRRAG